MKILFIIDNGFPTHQPDVSALFGTFLARLGVRTDIVACRNDGADVWPAGNAFLATHRGGRMRSRMAEFLFEAKLLFRIASGEYSAIQVRNKIFISIVAICTARRLGIPYFYWMSYPTADAAIRLAREQRQSVGVLRWLYLLMRGYAGSMILRRLIMPAAHHIFVQSDTMRSQLAEQKVPLGKMTVIPMGIDPARFSSLPQADVDDRLRGRQVIAYLGTCARVRRIDFLFDVILRLRLSYPNILLLIIGDATEPQDKVWLRNRIDEVGVGAEVMLTGWLPQDVAQSYLATAEVALAVMAPDPLLVSTSPTKLVEYLAMGKPVVANDHPDQRKVIAESGAGLCVTFDATIFSEAIAALLSDPERRETMSKLGKAYVSNKRSYDTISAYLNETYRSFGKIACWESTGAGGQVTTGGSA